jgi:VWFA-related protein
VKGVRLRTLGGASSAAALVGVALAQTPAPQPPTFRTEVNYVRVDVFPTNGDGTPILDLKQEDFEVLESGTPQKIEQFEHVVIRAMAQDTRIDPNTVREARAMLENPRARVFVVFLDIGHVTIEGSHRIRQPLTDTLNRLIGPDDLVGVMTPDMSPTDIAFARKTTTIEGFLARHWTWGESQRTFKNDPIEQMYEYCFPDGGTAAEMIERRRQKLTIDAFRDLAVFLRGVREERKAIIAVSDGFQVVGPDSSLMQTSPSEAPPSGPPVVVDPRTGRLGTRDTNNTAGVSQSDCWRDRMQLASWDGQDEFRRMLDVVNRANASFYPVNPRGLEVFDSPISQPLPLSVDLARVRARTDMLRTLAENTDGVAVVNTNDLGGALKRVVDDLSNYYLLGYYSTGKLDGRFHPISVRVKRSGVQVRARRGYLALTPAGATEAAAARAAAPGSKAPDLDPASAAAAHAIESAISPLAGYTRDVPLRLQIAAGWKPGDAASASLWAVGELGSVAVVGDAWSDGFDATATLTTPADVTVATGRVTAPRGAHTFRVALTPSQPLAPGDYVLRVGARAGAASIPSRDTAHIAIPQAPDSTGALFLRRGPTTGNKELPTADLRFRRNEQIRVEVPTASSDPISARLLDRTGKPLAVPVAAALRDDADGSRWRTAQLALAPLAPGDYVIEIASGDQRMLSAFRVVP